ncbi:TPA: replication protein C, IncQ-type [Stenotrophomonas maltophilia]
MAKTAANHEVPADEEGSKKGGIPERKRIKASEVQVIRQDRALMTPGLFTMNRAAAAQKKVISRTEDTVTEQSIRLETTTVIKGTEIRFSYTPLNADDLRMLHGLVAMVSGEVRGEIFAYSAHDISDDAQKSWSTLGAGAKAFGDTMILIKTSKRQLAEAGRLGLDPKHLNGRTLKSTMDSIKRLTQVHLYVREADGDHEYGAPLISSFSRDKTKIQLSLNPRIISAVMGTTLGAFSAISMTDLRNLRGDAAVLLFNRLCAVCDPGSRPKPIGAEKVESYIWGNILTKAATRGERLARKRTIERAFSELQACGWDIECIRGGYGKPDTWLVGRPLLPRKNTPQQVQMKLGFGGDQQDDNEGEEDGAGGS